MVVKVIKWLIYLSIGMLIFSVIFLGIDNIFHISTQSKQPQVAEVQEEEVEEEPVEKAPAAATETTQPAETTPQQTQTPQPTKSSSSKHSQETYVKVDGMRAIQDYGDMYFPYGWNLHNVMGVLAVEPQSDGSWFVKAECDFENEYGNKIDGVCEATIVGSDENWTVTSFNVYEQ